MSLSKFGITSHDIWTCKSLTNSMSMNTPVSNFTPLKRYITDLPNRHLSTKIIFQVKALSFCNFLSSNLSFNSAVCSNSLRVGRWETRNRGHRDTVVKTGQYVIPQAQKVGSVNRSSKCHPFCQICHTKFLCVIYLKVSTRQILERSWCLSLS